MLRSLAATRQLQPPVSSQAMRYLCISLANPPRQLLRVLISSLLLSQQRGDQYLGVRKVHTTLVRGSLIVVVYPPELYPLHVRAKAVALSTSANWAVNFALVYVVPYAFAQIQWKVYLIFAVFCAVMFIHVFFLFPETSQKPLEQVDQMFDDTILGRIKLIGKPAWYIFRLVILKCTTDLEYRKTCVNASATACLENNETGFFEK